MHFIDYKSEEKKTESGAIKLVDQHYFALTL